jgi:hypothetical protein
VSAAWLSCCAGDLEHVQRVLQPERSPEVASLVESVWPLLLHSTNRLAQQEQAEANRLSQEQVGCMCPSILHLWLYCVFALLFEHEEGVVECRHRCAKLRSLVSTGLH